MGGAGGAATAGRAGGAGGSTPSAPCFDWKTVANLDKTAEDTAAWQAGEEKLPAPAVSVRQYICLGALANMTASVGKAVYGYGCYVPRGSGPYKDTTDIQILVSQANPACLGWAPLVSGALPANVQPLGPALNSVPVCRAAYDQNTPDGLPSSGTHVGEAVPVGSSYNCRFEFYNKLVTVSDFTVLVRLSP